MKVQNLQKVFGPGILFASTAIGVSHLVQSTRAGANYGYALLGVVIAINILKYPFFEYASRYTCVTGKSIIEGYRELGKWVLWLYFLVTIGSLFFVTAAVGFVTAGFMDNLFGLSSIWPSFSLFSVTLVFLCCLFVLFIGKFSILDNLMKVIGATLVISTLIAFALALFKGSAPQSIDFEPPVLFDDAGVLFLIALMGWMPTALDLSSWTSLWAVEKIKSTGYQPTLKESLFDFNFGYWIAAILALCFLTLGANLLYGTGIELPGSSAGFASKVIQMYTHTMGDWSFLLIGTASFSIMLGTSLGVFDGYVRALRQCLLLLFYNDSRLITTDKSSAWHPESKQFYRLVLLVIAAISFGVIHFFMDHFKGLIDLATTISFMIAPFVAIANFKLVSVKYMGATGVPPLWMRMLSYLGILFLSAFALFYLYIKTRLF